jgi:hypothetical protein
MRLLVIGGSDAGIAAALHARELDSLLEHTAQTIDAAAKRVTVTSRWSSWGPPRHRPGRRRRRRDWHEGCVARRPTLRATPWFMETSPVAALPPGGRLGHPGCGLGIRPCRLRPAPAQPHDREGQAGDNDSGNHER